MDFKGSLRGIKKLIGVNSSPSKYYDAQDGPNIQRGRSPASMLAFPSTPDRVSYTVNDGDHDSFAASPSFKKKRSSHFTASMKNRMMGRKASKAELYTCRKDSAYDEHSLEDEFTPSSPIPILNPLEVVLPKRIKESKSLEDLIAPGGYPPSVLSCQQEDARTEPSYTAVVKETQKPPPLPARPLPTRPALQQLTSFTMDDVFEDDICEGKYPVLIGISPPPETFDENGEAVTRPACLAPFKSPNTGHVDHTTRDWHFYGPTCSTAIVRDTARTASAELRHLQSIMRSASGTLLAALSGDTQALATPNHNIGTDPIECPATQKWYKLSLKEAISIIHDVRLYESYIDKYGVEAFAKAIKNGFLTPSDHPDFIAKHFCVPSSSICPSIASTAQMSTFGSPLERCGTSDHDRDGSKWLAQCKIGIEDSEAECEDGELEPMNSVMSGDSEDENSPGAVVDGYAKAREDLRA